MEQIYLSYLREMIKKRKMWLNNFIILLKSTFLSRSQHRLEGAPLSEYMIPGSFSSDCLRTVRPMGFPLRQATAKSGNGAQ